MRNILIILAVALTSCQREEFRRDYVCTIHHAVNGRGTERLDTLYNKTEREVEQYCTAAYISNDSVFHQVTCQ